jgi:hypothetical protein
VAWWCWVLLWAVLLIWAAGVFFVLGRSLWRKGKVLAVEILEASDRLGAVAEQLQELVERAQSEPAVFTDPAQLRQERYLAKRGRDGQRSNPKNEPGQPSKRRLRERVR